MIGDQGARMRPFRSIISSQAEAILCIAARLTDSSVSAYREIFILPAFPGAKKLDRPTGPAFAWNSETGLAA
jgi:hypothetical protein